MKTIIIAPHPDDEILGCGGTILKRLEEGNEIAWCLITSIKKEDGWKEDVVLRKNREIEEVRKKLGINSINLFRLNLKTSNLDQISKQLFIEKISKVFKKFQPNEIFLPFPGDAHSDHKLTFEATIACTKWFRYKFIKKVLAYETLSETNFNFDPNNKIFNPNLFVDISSRINKKIELMNIYNSEVFDHPFPRSEESIKSLAKLRGSQSGYRAAEAFMILYQRES